MLLKEFFKLGQLLDTGCAVGSPEVDKDNSAALVGQMEFSAVKSRRRKIRKLLAGFIADGRIALIAGRRVTFIAGRRIAFIAGRRVAFIAGRRITFIADRGLICRDLCGLCKRFRSFGLILCERNRFAG